MRNIQIVLNAILSKNIFEYILVDKDLKIQNSSDGLKKYLGLEPKENDDILKYLPELVGNEDEIKEIFIKKYCLYSLESVYKNEYYVNISIEYCDQNTAIILLHNITAVTLSKQKILQYSNESTLLYNTLQKVVDNQNALLFVVNSQNIKFANQKFMDYFNLNSIEDIRKNELNIYKTFDNTFKSYDELFIHLEGKESYIKIGNDTFMLHATLVESIHKLFTLTKVTTLSDKLKWDTLTGAYRKSYFNTEFEKIIKEEKKCALSVFDLDNFKQVNDTYGHQVGDKILKEFATLIKSKMNKNDMLVRWGGEEFLLLLKNISSEEAMDKIENICHIIDKHSFSDIEHLTASFGVASLTEDDDADSLFLRADKALYEAKLNGKNQVMLKEV